MRSTDPAAAVLLTTAYRHAVNEPNVEAGYERFHAINGDSVDYLAFCRAVATCLREGLIHEPIRLADGALQCRWHLELTPSGSAAAREILQSQSPSQGLIR
jgi:hypothetical protein